MKITVITGFLTERYMYINSSHTFLLTINLKDKSILITGSSRGIGKSIAHHCALHGAKVIISSRKLDACEATASEINKAVGTEAAFPIPANISDENQLNDLVSLTKEKLGRIDTLICNAATNPFMGSMLDMPSEKFDKVMNNNIKSSFLVFNGENGHDSFLFSSKEYSNVIEKFIES